MSGENKSEIGGYNQPGLDSLVGQWRLDEDHGTSSGGDTVKDYSGENKDGTTKGSVDTSAARIFGTNSYGFDGGNDHVDMGEIIKLTEDSYTVTAWIKPSQCTSYGNIIGAAEPEGDFLRPGGYKSIDSSCHLRDYDGERIISNNPVDVEEWNFVAFSWDEDNIYRMFINGEEDKIKEDVQSNDHEDGELFIKSIGRFSEDVGRYFPGKMDEVQIYDRALSEDEVEELYFQGMDDTFEASYISEAVDDFEFHDWQGIDLNYSVPSGTEANLTFQAMDDDNDVLDEQVEELDGTESFDLDVSNSSQARVLFDLESSDVEASTVIEGFEVLYEEGEAPFMQEGLVGHWNAVSMRPLMERV